MAQFDRIYRLTVGVQGSDGVVIEAKAKEQGLHMTFDISKDLTQQTNKCRISIYNLSDTTSKKMEREDSICLLEVGYAEDIGLRRIFVGYVISAVSKYQGTDKITELTLSDGQIAIRDCVVSLSYADNVSRKKVIDDIAQEMGLLVTYADGLTFNTFANGFSFIGAGRACLDKACAGTNLSWSIQNNVLQVIESGGSTKVQALKITPSSGLVGSVERIIKAPTKVDKNKTTKKSVSKAKDHEKKAGWKLTCLLQPTLNPGDLIYIESKVATGWFKIETLRHTGGYEDSAWYTEMEVYEIVGETNE